MNNRTWDSIKEQATNEVSTPQQAYDILTSHGLGLYGNSLISIAQEVRAMEIEREILTTSYHSLLSAATRLIEYRKRFGSLGWQLEKADDYIREIEQECEVAR